MPAAVSSTTVAGGTCQTSLGSSSWAAVDRPGAAVASSSSASVAGGTAVRLAAA